MFCRVAGGGAVEAALHIYLDSFAKTLGSREQLAIAEFAEALLVIPKTLAVNAGKVPLPTYITIVPACMLIALTAMCFGWRICNSGIAIFKHRLFGHTQQVNLRPEERM